MSILNAIKYLHATTIASWNINLISFSQKFVVVAKLTAKTRRFFLLLDLQLNYISPALIFHMHCEQVFEQANLFGWLKN